jgi:NADH-quinone oxidoreductase subunit K
LSSVRSANREVPAVVTAAHFLVLAAALFTIGAAGVFLRRSTVIVLMSIELMLNAVNITFVAASRALLDMNGHIYVFISLTVAAAEVAVGLALVVAIFRNYGRADTDDLRALRG